MDLLDALGAAALIAAATLLSEDLASVGAGLMVAAGSLGFFTATLGAFAGIASGDLMLYAAGRWVGRPALARAPLRWLLCEEDVRRASEWLASRGRIVIPASRLLPGLRLPTYFAAGLLGIRPGPFALWTAAAAAVWTPLVVGASALAGSRAASVAAAWQRLAGYALLLAAAALAGAAAARRRRRRPGAPAGAARSPGAWFRARRHLAGRLRRLRRWEFWPPWLFYLPVVLHVLWLGLRHRSVALFTAANPAIEAGGFVAESKSRILEGLVRAGAPVARFTLLPADLPVGDRFERAEAFLRREGIGFPVVLKPDAGQRGSGVAVVRDAGAMRAYLAAAPYDVILQERVEGPEFGVFYCRRPGEEHGRIFSITEKRLPELVGDGRRSLEELILADARAVSAARLHLERHAARLGEIPEKGERVRLVELGTHSRGAIFLDGSRLWTPALEAAVDAFSRRYEGFHFGRYDLRAPSVEDLTAGRNLAILELNGVTSESTDIYDPSRGLLDAYGRLFEQWRLAFEIGARNRARGAAPARLRDLLRLASGFRRLRSLHAAAARPGAGAAPASA